MTAAAALFAPSNFEIAQRMATALSKSNLIPTQFQNNLPNCLIALEMATRMGASPMAVMQNLYIVHGKPAWSSQFIIAAINSTGHFSPLRFKIEGEGDKRQCTAWAVELGTNEKLEGPAVSIAMAKQEGWYGKNGSKWQTLPELMLRYRAATFFGRLYAPEVLMGMREETEVIDVDTTATVIERPKFPALTQEEGHAVLSNSPLTTTNGLMKMTNTPTITKKLKVTKSKKKEIKGSITTGSDPSGLGGKTTVFSEPTLKSAQPSANAIEIEKRLKAAGYTAKDLLKVALANEWVDALFGEEPDKFQVAMVPEDKLATFLEEWGTVAEQIDALPK